MSEINPVGHTEQFTENDFRDFLLYDRNEKLLQRRDMKGNTIYSK